MNAQQEAENLEKATNWALSYLKRKGSFKITENFFLTLHSKILEGDSRGGEYRTKLHVLKIPGKTFQEEEPWKIKIRMVDLADLLSNDKKWYPIFRNLLYKKHPGLFGPQQKNIRRTVYEIFMPWYFHHELVVIHPFQDGNGRLARLLMCLLLRKMNYAHAGYPVVVNSVIKKDKPKYLDALNHTDRGAYLHAAVYVGALLQDAYKETIDIMDTLRGQLKLPL